MARADYERALRITAAAVSAAAAASCNAPRGCVGHFLRQMHTPTHKAAMAYAVLLGC